jgi:non-heme chloroperoxidase
MTRTVPQISFATTRLATGVNLHYAEQGTPGAEPILFLHGWPDSWYSYSRVLELLAPGEFHSFTIDQRGFGDSDRPDRGYTIDDYAADAVAFLDAVGVDQATVVGHSFGSFVARRIAQTVPRQVRRLALIGSAVSPVNAVMLEVRDIVQNLHGCVSAEFAREFAAGTLHAPVPEAFFERIVAECLKAPATTWQRSWDGILAFDDTGQLGRISAPTLIIWGEHDALFTRDDQTGLVDAIPGARLLVYPGTGHCPNWERPEQVAADLAAFVEGDG